METLKSIQHCIREWNEADTCWQEPQYELSKDQPEPRQITNSNGHFIDRRVYNTHNQHQYLERQHFSNFCDYSADTQHNGRNFDTPIISSSSTPYRRLLGLQKEKRRKRKMIHNQINDFAKDCEKAKIRNEEIKKMLSKQVHDLETEQRDHLVNVAVGTSVVSYTQKLEYENNTQAKENEESEKLRLKLESEKRRFVSLVRSEMAEHEDKVNGIDLCIALGAQNEAVR